MNGLDQPKMAPKMLNHTVFSAKWRFQKLRLLCFQKWELAILSHIHILCAFVCIQSLFQVDTCSFKQFAHNLVGLLLACQYMRKIRIGYTCVQNFMSMRSFCPLIHVAFKFDGFRMHLFLKIDISIQRSILFRSV